MIRTILAAALVLAPTSAGARCWKPGQNVSWYGEPQKLSDGSEFDPKAETCASRKHPPGTVLRVTDLDTGLGVECAVNDWGPHPWTNCELDVSREAAVRLGVLHRGIVRAKIEVVRAVWPETRWSLLERFGQEKGPEVAPGPE